MRTENAPFSLPRAVLFDMDGTLTRPLMDFARIKAEMGIGARPILEAMAEMDEGARRAAEMILRRHEERATAESTLNEGCDKLFDWLRERRVRTALITRNSRTSVLTVLRRHALDIGVTIAREDAPPKPDPKPLWLACGRLGVEARDAWMVGDGQYDVEAGVAAGVRTVWVSHDRTPQFAATPWRTVRDLCELQTLLAAADR